MMRDRMSRPSWSVPNQKVPPSANAVPGLAIGRSCALGSNGAISGANTAIPTQKATSAAPTIPTGLSRNRAKDLKARVKAAPFVGAGRRVFVRSLIRPSP